MKLFFLLILLSTQSVLARTGTKTFSHSIKAETEQELLNKAEIAIPLIQSGKIKAVFQMGCWPNNSRTIKVKSLSVKKYYSVESDNTLTPYFTGSISYHHRRCRIEK
jgi:hypothetical protein